MSDDDDYGCDCECDWCYQYDEQTIGETAMTIAWTFLGTLVIVGTIIGIALWIS